MCHLGWRTEMRTMIADMRCRLWLALSLVICLTVSGLAWAAGEGGTAAPPRDPAAYDAVAGQVAACLHVATCPRELRFGGVGVQWVMGDPDVWSPSCAEGIKRWVGRGHVCWMDVSLTSRFGITDSVGGGTDQATVAAEAKGHPLVAGVNSISCMDTFRYMRGLPMGALPVMVCWNRWDHVVVGVWPLGKGLIIFRPEARPAEITWLQRGERRWVEPDVADGARLLHNINVLTLETLKNAGFAVPRAARNAPMPRWPLL